MAETTFRAMLGFLEICARLSQVSQDAAVTIGAVVVLMLLVARWILN